MINNTKEDINTATNVAKNKAKQETRLKHITGLIIKAKRNHKPTNHKFVNEAWQTRQHIRTLFIYFI